MESLLAYSSSEEESYDKAENKQTAEKLKKLEISDKKLSEKKLYGPQKPARLTQLVTSATSYATSDDKSSILKDYKEKNIAALNKYKHYQNSSLSSSDNKVFCPPIPSTLSRSEDPDLVGQPVTPTLTRSENADLVGPPVTLTRSKNADLVGPTVLPTLKRSEDASLKGPPIPSNSSSTSERNSDIGPPIPEDLKKIQNSSTKMISPSDDDSSEEEDEAKEFAIPLEKEINFIHGSKAVTGLAVDPAGARLASGAVDYEVKFWDFAGMDSSLHSFRSLYPCGNNPIKGIEYSCTGDAVLIVSGMCQAKVYDRDGIEILECVKGDQYIADLGRTKGHIAPLTSGIWHPFLRHEFMTASEDGSCRLWDVKTSSHHKNIMKCKTKNGLKTTPTACAYSRDGNLVACGCMDGSIQMWDHRRMFVNTAKLLRNAHEQGAEISSIHFAYHGNMFCTRSCDDTLKLWDLRTFKSPIHVAKSLFSRYGSTSCTFSPNDSLVMTGESAPSAKSDGKLHIFKTATFEKVKEFSLPNSHIVKTIWHPKLNQVFLGCGDGKVKIFYDEDNSARGAKLFIGKKKTKKRQSDVCLAVSQQIITPHSLPLFRQEKNKPSHKKIEKERQDPIKSHRPDLPIKSGQGGRVAASGSTLSSYVIRNLGLSKRVEDDQDPREAILRFAKDAAENPYWIAPAYKKTQPHAIFKDEEGDEGDEKESKKPRLI